MPWRKSVSKEGMSSSRGGSKQDFERAAGERKRELQSTGGGDGLKSEVNKVTIQDSSVEKEGAVVKRDEVGGGGDVWTHPEEHRQHPE